MGEKRGREVRKRERAKWRVRGGLQCSAAAADLSVLPRQRTTSYSARGCPLASSPTALAD